jgi:hypothetical protein
MRRLTAVFLLGIIVLAGPASARTWYILANGTGDAPTIKAGLDSASAGDTVLVATGTYYEYGIHLKSGVAIESEAADVRWAVIDGQGQGRVIIADGVDASGQIEYFTITGGQASGSGSEGCGGGMLCTNYSTPTVRMCLFRSNVADNIGGGMYCDGHSAPYLDHVYFRENEAGMGGGGLGCTEYSNPTVYTSAFRGNRTDVDGGAVHCSNYAAPAFDWCTFINNAAMGCGGVLYSGANSTPSLMRCILAFSADGEGACAADDASIPSFACCDLYGNDGGDWVGRIADQDSTEGNFSADPLFCDTSDFYFEITNEVCSPCLHGNHPDGYNCAAHIGNGGPACECGEATKPSTWGGVKALYK